MCTFFEKIVRFRYVVQNMLWILCANFKPFQTKIGLLRAIQSFRDQWLSCRIDGTRDNNCSLKLQIALRKPVFVRNRLKLAHNIRSIFCTTYPNLTIFSNKVHILILTILYENMGSIFLLGLRISYKYIFEPISSLLWYIPPSQKTFKKIFPKIIRVFYEFLDPPVTYIWQT